MPSLCCLHSAREGLRREAHVNKDSSVEKLPSGGHSLKPRIPIDGGCRHHATDTRNRRSEVISEAGRQTSRRQTRAGKPALLIWCACSPALAKAASRQIPGATSKLAHSRNGSARSLLPLPRSNRLSG